MSKESPDKWSLAQNAAGQGSLLCMPLLIINMGGEMLYILEQRLQAQDIAHEKAKKVLGDVTKAMYDPSFIQELFVPQPVYSMRPTRQVFDRLAHSSIMKLNKTSMDKLFDLMTMGFKYQLIMATHPSEVLDISFNHMESIKEIVNKPEITKLIDEASEAVLNTYSNLPTGELWRLKHTLAGFFQDRRVKVSLFLQDGLQNYDGTFYLGQTREGPVTNHGTPPGKVFYYSKEGTLNNTETVPMLKHEKAQPPVAPYSSARRMRTGSLGMNIYAKDKQNRVAVNRKPLLGPNNRSSINGNFAGAESPSTGDKQGEEQKSSPEAKGPSSPGASKETTPEQKKQAASGDGRAGLNMLASLIGNNAPESKDDDQSFKLDLFGSESSFGFGYQAEASGNKASHDDGSEGTLVITVDADDRNSLQKLSKDLHLDDWDAERKVGDSKENDDDEDELLGLMDQAGI